MRPFIFVSALLLTATPLLAQAPATPAKEPPFKEIAPGVFQMGPARVEKAAKTVSFPGAVNLDVGAIEYLLVTSKGPTHESLLVTEFSPQELNVLMLLLGAKGAPAPKAGDAPPEQITNEYLKHAPSLAGTPVSITITWKDAAGAEKTAPVEDWLLFGEDPDKLQPVTRGPWLYTGSMFGQVTGQFVAEAEGLHAALVTNPSALFNNPRPGHTDDKAWSVNRKSVPKAETPITITIKLLPK